MSRRWRGNGVYKTMTFRGERVEISVDSDGMFYGSCGIDSHKADTLKALVAKLRRSANKRKLKVAIPATLIHVSKHSGTGYDRKYLGETCRRIVMHSINPKTHEINFTYEENGDPGSAERYGRSHKFGKPMTDAEIAEWERLYREKVAAEDRFEKFEGKFTGESHDYRKKDKTFDALAIVEAALQAKADEAVEPDDDTTGDPRVDAPTPRKRAG